MTSISGTASRSHLLLTCAAIALATPTALAEPRTEEVSQPALLENPFFQDWTTPYNAPPFDLITADDFIPAFEQAMTLHTAEIAVITDNPEPATFENTIVALELAGGDLERIQRTFSTLSSAATNDEIRAIQSEMSPRLAAHNSAIALNEALFERIAPCTRRQMRSTSIQNKRACSSERTRDSSAPARRSKGLIEIDWPRSPRRSLGAIRPSVKMFKKMLKPSRSSWTLTRTKLDCRAQRSAPQRKRALIAAWPAHM